MHVCRAYYPQLFLNTNILTGISAGFFLNNDYKLYFQITGLLYTNLLLQNIQTSTVNQMDLHLVQNRKKNCQHDHIPLKLK